MTLTYIGIKIPKTLKDAVEHYVSYDTHATISDFVRDAIRFYLHEKAPGLLEQVVDNSRKQKSLIFGDVNGENV